MSYDPWADLARRTGVELRWHTGRVSNWERPLGVTDFGELSITLLLGQDEAQIRSTLAHELVHLERGPVGLPWANKTVAGEESRVTLIAAQRLIAPEDYDRWLRHRSEETASGPEAREFCRVDTGMLRAYHSWRQRVSEASALRAHARAAEPAAWPPPWLAENTDQYDLAARFAGIEERRAL